MASLEKTPEEIHELIDHWAEKASYYASEIEDLKDREREARERFSFYVEEFQRITGDTCDCRALGLKCLGHEGSRYNNGRK